MTSGDTPPPERRRASGQTPLEAPRRAAALDRAKQEAVHGPLYACSFQNCAEENTYPPDDIYWVEDNPEHPDWSPGWYCFNCISYNDSPDRGESLQDFLDRQSALERKVLDWLAADQDIGLSSKSLAFAALGREFKWGGTWGCNYPHDPSDLRRCVLFLNKVPEARFAIDELAKVSLHWAGLAAEWDHLCGLLAEEMAGDTGMAHKTYDAMQKALELGERG